MERIYETFLKKHIPIAIFMDLSKAFDTLNHEILIWKLQQYGVHNNALSLLVNYLQNRQQFVSYKSKVSKCLPIKIGVPQGSNLDPLFLSFI